MIMRTASNAGPSAHGAHTQPRCALERRSLAVSSSGRAIESLDVLSLRRCPLGVVADAGQQVTLPRSRAKGYRKRGSVFPRREGVLAHGSGRAEDLQGSRLAAGFSFVLDDANLGAKRRQIRAGQTALITNLAGDHVSHLNDATVQPMVRAWLNIPE